MTDTQAPDTTFSPLPVSLFKRAFWYAVTLAAVQFVALLLTFWSTTRPWFLTHDAYPMAAILGYAERSAGLNCQLLLAGDSTALAGFNPAVFQRRTGLTACNIGEIKTISEFFGTHHMIDDYLQRNTPPRFLIFGVSPANLEVEHEPWRMTGPEEFVYAMQYDRSPWLWRGMLHHPRDTFGFVTWAETRIVEDSLWRLAHPHAPPPIDERKRRSLSRGQWIVNAPPQTACSGHGTYYPTTHEKNQAEVTAFRKHYTTPTTTVLFFLTPVADCHDDLPNLRRLSQGVADNELQTEPIGNFNGTDIHLTTPAADGFSNQVADRLLAVITRQNSQQANNTPSQPVR